MFSATDVVNFLACRHLGVLNREAMAGKREKPFFEDPSQELLRELGIRHEQNYLQQLMKDQKLTVRKIPDELSWPEAVRETTEALRSGADVVYQGTLEDGTWNGRSDFLVKVLKPSLLGAWSYEVVETKLARSAKAHAVLQLCFYSDLLSKIQGSLPERMHVVLGDSSLESFAVARYIAYFRKIRNDFLRAGPALVDTYPEPVELCKVCTWFSVCDKQRHDDDHLSLVAGITRNQRKQLVAREIQTLEALGSLELPVAPKIEGIGEAALLRIHGQALLQQKGRSTGEMIYELLGPIEEEKGFAALPVPSGGDVFLDFEGDPFAFGTGVEYLLGTLSLEDDPNPTYESRWSFEPSGEKRVFEDFIAKMLDRLSKFPDFHIYHYAPYEQTAIKKLAGRHGVCVDGVDQLLRAGIFVDLYRVTRQALRASVESYSIKKLEPLYGFNRSVPLREARLALDTFASIFALGTGEEATVELQKTVESYNREDCLSARHLRDWLEERRKEMEEKLGRAIPRPQPKSGEAKENLAEQLERVEQVKKKLLEGLPGERSAWTPEGEARWLLAQLLDWHRREEKSMWWEYFRLCDLSDAELIEDKSALGGLHYLRETARIKRSAVHRYGFPPQDHAIDRALDIHDPKTKSGAGTLVAIDEIARTIDLKRGLTSAVPHPSALVPFDFLSSEVKRESLLRTGTWVGQNGITGEGFFESARDLLLRRRPRALKAAIEMVIDAHGQLTEETKRLVESLCAEPSILPIQGPPGSGKTFSGARMIVELVKGGHRVGIAAISHKVISHLLGEACQVAREAGVAFKAVQKPNETDGCPDESVQQLDDNALVLEALKSGRALVAAGTGWLWARSEMHQSVDVLFIDEAGQMCLADVLAVSQAATSCVLLGDPQQLDQPQRGVHPPGVDGSAFRHLLGQHATILPEQGLFLAETQRLHPDVCGFISELFYEGRLLSAAGNEKQKINAKGRLSGTSLRFVAVSHSGNQNESMEEVNEIAKLIRELLDGESTWTDRRGRVSRLTLDDVLVVTPYNAQVSALREALPKGAHVGTVDKFQGQQAPVIFYSMATSTAADAPRGMEFLYSSNRLNVAISRAQCIAVLVASPALFEMECKSPEQIALANAFCSFLERAQAL